MTVDTAFLEFRETGDPEAMGRVFDGASHALSLVAARIAPPGVAPEDLVQEAFVVAIEKADRFDARRPLLQWLVGILVKVALVERRRGRRVLDPERLSATAEVGPDELAAAREVATRVQAAVATMPAGYRSALVLHLVHGLTAAEISRALELPFRTAQSRLRRGLELLRGVLPAGLACGLMASADVLAAARATIVRAARCRHTATRAAATSVVGVAVSTAVKTATLLLAGAVALGAGYGFLPGPSAPVNSGMATSRSDRDEREAVDAPDAQPVHAVVAVASRTVLPAPMNAQDPARSSLEIRVVDDATGLPVERFGVVCFGVDPRREVLGNRRLREQGVHTAGRLRIEGLHRVDTRLLVLPESNYGLAPSGYVPVQIRKAKEEITIRLRAWIRVPIRVIDEDGQPIVGTRVQLLQRLCDNARRDAVLPIDGDYRSSHWMNYLELASARTGREGALVLPWQPWETSARLRVTGPGHVTTEQDAPAIRRDMPVITLRVARGCVLRGKITPVRRLAELSHVLGEPIPFRHVDLAPAIVLRNVETGVLDEGRDAHGYPIAADGSFVADGLLAGRWSVLLRYLAPERGGNARLVTTRPEPLAEVVLGHRDTERVELDFTTLLPSAAHGRVFWNGVEAKPQKLGFQSWYRDPSGRRTLVQGIHGPLGVEPGGYRLRGLPAGELVFSATFRCEDGKQRTFYTLEPVVLRASENRVLDLHFEHRIARIRLQRPDRKTPVASRLVRLLGRHTSWMTTDRDGWLTLDPVTMRDFEVEVYPEGVDQTSALRRDPPRLSIGKVRIHTGRRRFEQILVVPDGK
ncbi:MAG: sigma-70 family RNA polymerase sigma factor [Planctomycetes bacterium]|nr:sigma-70 family RNA polymerase sigma factor [Planctomycetota bacterium]